MILQYPLIPAAKDGVLRVVTLGRISTPGQDPDSVKSQHLDQDRWLEMNYSGPTRIRHYGEQVSGWVVDREMMDEVMNLIKAGDLDLVLVAELREVYRNPALLWKFLFHCVDCNVRFISVADGIDTLEPDWEVPAHIAIVRYGMTGPEARRRVRRKASYTFSRGGMVLKIKYGYRKLSKEQAESGEYGPKGLRIANLPEATPYVRAMARRLVRGDSYTVLAEWLNDEGIIPGPYVKSGKWTGRLVKDLLSDPVLSGRRRFRRTRSKLVYATGFYRSETNPEEPETQEYPELAHLTDEEHAEVMAVIRARAAAAKASQRIGKDSPLWRRPRKRSLWPGQHARCPYCEGLMYRYGRFLRCRNTLSGSTKECWNHVQIDFEVLRAKVLPWVVGILNDLPGFHETIVDTAWSEFKRLGERRLNTGQSVGQRIHDLGKQAGNLAKAIAAAGEIDALVQELGVVEAARIAALEEQKALFVATEEDAGFLSREDVDARLDEALQRLAQTTFEFADTLRRLIPRFEIWAVQQLDRPQIRPLAKLTLRLPDSDGSEYPTTIELFPRPLHIQHMQACVECKHSRPELTYEQIGQLLGVNRMVVKRALDYARKMTAEGMTEPYRLLTDRPETASRWKPRSTSVAVEDPEAA